ncbi:serine/threonine-protein kinase atm [Quercus suber]|uniref:Serine/threonine-protein kinase atm n=1 Tax=Quercus suber TaxID=58331 RepID=A0AAW0IUG2_QUESU
MTKKKSIERQSQVHFHFAHYADALFRSNEDRLTSNEWQAAMRSRKHKVPSILNERVVLFLPVALYALCAGCAPFKKCYSGFLLSYSFVDDAEATLEQVKTEDYEHDSLHEVFECSVEVLARIVQDCGFEALKYCVENHSISLDFI